MHQLKRLVKSILPARIATTIIAYRSRNYQLRYIQDLGIPSDNAAFVHTYGDTIMGGPFRGMSFPYPELGSRPVIPYLLGCVEKELHPVLQSLLSSRYECALNIGCAEGYYAVGLAWLLRIPVYAYD